MASFHTELIEQRRGVMAIQLIEQLLADPDPAFACFANGDDGQREAFLAPLAHFANPGAEAVLLDRMPSVPGAERAREVYAAYNGLLLYTDREKEVEGIEIFPIQEWKERTAQMVESWAEGNYPDKDMPYGRDDFIAFAHVSGASSCIHWAVRGPRAGAVYWWPGTMRPDKDTPPMATDFGTFISLLSDRPSYFLNVLLPCYTRFSDGRTQTEWLPRRYLPDRRKRSVGR